MTGLCLMLLDVLSEFDAIKLCLQYEHNGEKLDHFPARLEVIEECKPVYREMAGWKRDISACRTYEQLPAAAKDYIKAVEDATGVPVKFISVGPRRDQTIVRETIF
jgi:adenylosuccinate synthase